MEIFDWKTVKKFVKFFKNTNYKTLFYFQNKKTRTFINPSHLQAISARKT